MWPGQGQPWASARPRAVTHLFTPLRVLSPAGRAAHHLCHPWAFLFNVQTTLSIIAKKKKKKQTWKQPKSPSTGEWRNDLWYIHAWGCWSAASAMPGTRGRPPGQHARERRRTQATRATTPFTQRFKHRLCFRAVLGLQRHWTESSAHSQVPLGHQLTSPSVSGVRTRTQQGKRWG